MSRLEKAFAATNARMQSEFGEDMSGTSKANFCSCCDIDK